MLKSIINLFCMFLFYHFVSFLYHHNYITHQFVLIMIMFVSDFILYHNL